MDSSDQLTSTVTSTVVEQLPEPPSQTHERSDFRTTVRVYQTIAELEEIRHIWASWKGYRDSDIDFYLEFIQTRKEVLRPHVVALYRNGVPEALLIGRLERTRMQFK